MTPSQGELEAAVKKTVLLFNRLRSPQAVTRLVHVSPELVIIAFSGSFCYDCGDVQKFVVDFAKDFKVFIDYAELTEGKIRETTPRTFEVSYLVKPR
ncbi:MAG: hypothetical protein NWF05_07480 [Candidatus Bathyarchaeota archaeon]|nr:hypothetical protein [Candidatus Bathyarchaeota archaeon]